MWYSDVINFNFKVQSCPICIPVNKKTNVQLRGMKAIPLRDGEMVAASPDLLVQQRTVAAQWWLQTRRCGWRSLSRQHRSRGPAGGPCPGDPAHRT